MAPTFRGMTGYAATGNERYEQQGHRIGSESEAGADVAHRHGAHAGLLMARTNLASALLLCIMHDPAVALPESRTTADAESKYAIQRIEISGGTLLGVDDCAPVDAAEHCGPSFFIEYRGPDHSSAPPDSSLSVLPKQYQWFISHVSNNPHIEARLCDREKRALSAWLRRAAAEVQPENYIAIRLIPDKFSDCFVLPAVTIPAPRLIGAFHAGRMIALTEIDDSRASFSLKAFYGEGAVVIDSPAVPRSLFIAFVSNLHIVYERMPLFFGGDNTPRFGEIEGVSIPTEIAP